MAASLVGRKRVTPLPPNTTPKRRKLGFFSGNRPLSANSIGWRRGGGTARKCLTFALFWPSANSPPWRKGVGSSNVSRGERNKFAPDGLLFGSAAAQAVSVFP